MRYLDTSSLIALYYPEEKTEPLIAHLNQHRLPLVFTWLHELELTNGLQLKLFRKEATAAAIGATLDAVHRDQVDGVLHGAQPTWTTVIETTLRLAEVHTGALGARTLDLLHIAAALTLQASEFVTGDKRQAIAAANEGLTVVRI